MGDNFVNIHIDLIDPVQSFDLTNCEIGVEGSFLVIRQDDPTGNPPRSMYLPERRVIRAIEQ